MRLVDTAVVGGGPAGAATASGLAKSGRQVLLIERSSGPHHKVCGEFLSADTRAYLADLGIDPGLLGAVPIDNVSLGTGIASSVVELPFRALSLSRFRLDQAILDCAVNYGAELRRGVSIQSAEPRETGWDLHCSDGEAVRCRNLVAATGKRTLRGIRDERDGSMVGFKMHLEPSAETARALAGRVELFLVDGGYAGLELVEDGVANFCLVLERKMAARVGRGWPALQDFWASAIPSLARRLDGALALWEKPIAVVCPIGGHLHTGSPRSENSVYHVGDRLAHIPPFTGDGLAVALASAALAVEHIRQGHSPGAYLAKARRLTASAVRLASIVSGLATYSIGRAALMCAAATMPTLLQMIARQTRLQHPSAR
jgi:flavin-dependent dehydrogenase